MKILCSQTKWGGFQFLLILYLWGISFHAVVVFGLGHCAHECSMHSFKSKRTLITSILAILCKKNCNHCLLFSQIVWKISPFCIFEQFKKRNLAGIFFKVTFLRNLIRDGRHFCLNVAHLVAGGSTAGIRVSSRFKF